MRNFRARLRQNVDARIGELVSLIGGQAARIEEKMSREAASKARNDWLTEGKLLQGCVDDLIGAAIPAIVFEGSGREEAIIRLAQGRGLLGHQVGVRIRMSRVSRHAEDQSDRLAMLESAARRVAEVAGRLGSTCRPVAQLCNNLAQETVAIAAIAERLRRPLDQKVMEDCRHQAAIETLIQEVRALMRIVQPSPRLPGRRKKPVRRRGGGAARSLTPRVAPTSQ